MKNKTQNIKTSLSQQPANSLIALGFLLIASTTNIKLNEKTFSAYTMQFEVNDEKVRNKNRMILQSIAASSTLHL